MAKDVVKSIQSNSLRGDYMRSIVNRAIDEIQADIEPMFGPGATDAFITKNNAIYYTRDGKEVLESLMFDDELASYVHHIIYQAVYNQGVKVGDGSTTLAVLYCRLYQTLWASDETGEDDLNLNLNETRRVWSTFISRVKAELKKRAVPLDDEHLLAMLYTCTHDPELSAKIYVKLKDAILAGAYIVPRKSNIDTDLVVTSYQRPLFKVTKHFSLLSSMDGEQENCVVFYCNGVLDIAHPEVLHDMVYCQMMDTNNEPKPLNIILLGHGLTEATRRTVREYSQFIKSNKMTATVNNIAIYTLDDYRSMSSHELEDVSAIFMEDYGMGSLVQPITYETLLYRVFHSSASQPIPELETFDMDTGAVAAMNEVLVHPYKITFDKENGMAVEKPLGPVAQTRYDALRKEIEEEKSPVRKYDLNKRLRRTFGMFIDVEVGSTLLKDSQRKFELILDALLSSTEAAREGVLEGNSLIHVEDVMKNMKFDDPYYADRYIYAMRAEFRDAIYDTMCVLVKNYFNENNAMCDHYMSYFWDNHTDQAKYFNLELGTEYFTALPEPIKVTVDDKTVMVRREVVEPIGVINAILDNSILAFELIKARVFHTSRPYQGNYID